jgi:hypothetical protein
MLPFGRKKKKQEAEPDVPTPDSAALAAMLGSVAADKAGKEESKAAAKYPGRRKESVALIGKGATKSEAGIWRFQIAGNRHCTVHRGGCIWHAAIYRAWQVSMLTLVGATVHSDLERGG